MVPTGSILGEYKKNVYNIADLSAVVTADLINNHDGNVCLRRYLRADETVVTSDCSLCSVAARLAEACAFARCRRADPDRDRGTLIAAIDATDATATDGPLARIFEWHQPARVLMGKMPPVVQPAQLATFFHITPSSWLSRAK